MPVPAGEHPGARLEVVARPSGAVRGDPDVVARLRIISTRECGRLAAAAAARPAHRPHPDEREKRGQPRPVVARADQPVDRVGRRAYRRVAFRRRKKPVVPQDERHRLIAFLKHEPILGGDFETQGPSPAPDEEAQRPQRQAAPPGKLIDEGAWGHKDGNTGESRKGKVRIGVKRNAPAFRPAGPGVYCETFRAFRWQSAFSPILFHFFRDFHRSVQHAPLLPPSATRPAGHRLAARSTPIATRIGVADFYLDCLEYSQALWQGEGRPARAILCLDRAFGAELRGDERRVGRVADALFRPWRGYLRHAPEGAFLGNPRVHFQHYAGRMNEPRREQRRWRAWACWALTRAVLPDLPGDPRHAIAEPALREIDAQLQVHGLSGEAELWRRVLEQSR